MFKKFFKPNYSGEENIYHYASSYISNIKGLLDTWIKNNKYRNIPELKNLLDLLLEIEMEINYLSNKKDPKLVSKISAEYEKLDDVLKRLKNKILSMCENVYDDENLLSISAELIKLRNLVARNINTPALKLASDSIGNYKFLESGISNLFTNITILERFIYTRKKEIESSEIKYR